MNTRKKKWTKEQLHEAVENSLSIRQVLLKLNLVGAGGNYRQIHKYLHAYKIDSSHFTGKGWRKDSKIPVRNALALEEILVRNSSYQSYKLKKRLFSVNLKLPKCEECGWAEISQDGRQTVELDHINGDRYDNRINNLRILCPNCHSLKPTHRGLNRKK